MNMKKYFFNFYGKRKVFVKRKCVPNVLIDSFYWTSDGYYGSLLV